MRFQQAFEVTQGDVVAFIGAGGKTSTLVAFGYELRESGLRVLATTTTKIREDQLDLMPEAVKFGADSRVISDALSEFGFVFLYDRIEDGNVYGPPLEAIPLLLDVVDSDVLLVEADGSSGRPLKAPGIGEPVIPSETTLVIPVLSLSVLGKPLDDDHVENSQAIIDRYGFVKGNPVRSPWVAQILRDDTLGLRDVPEDARIVAMLNRTPIKGYGRARARLIARLALRKSRLDGVAMGSVRTVEPIHEVRRPIGAIVLAAGLSTRMGEPKMLMPWTEKRSIIEHIIEQTLNSRLDHVTVVTGHLSKSVKRVIEPLGVDVVYNRGYKTGEMLSSIKAGLRAMPDNIAAAMIVLGDQPRIQPKVIYQVMMAYSEGRGDLIAPSFEMRRGHPILIGRRYWPEILNLPRHGSLRDVLDTHNADITYVTVDTDSVLRDVDTRDDYLQERWRAGLGRYSDPRSSH